ncbi:MAG TPA: hypothetical protein VOA41_02850 [Candidatus Dormibacteraeota bacterium]|nr:hypothetical protein [Candidatus Dormibacteraeota bacterium]
MFVLGMVLLSSAGVGAAMVAVRSGKAQMVAQLVLTSLFVQVVLVTVIIGFGMNAMFSDAELRRYPVNALDRRLTRHLIAMVDPFWFLVLALELGLVIGLYALGVAALGLSLFAILLLLLSLPRRFPMCAAFPRSEYYQRVRLPPSLLSPSGWSIRLTYSACYFQAETAVDLPGAMTLPFLPMPCS